MKRLLMISLLALSVTALVCAQGRDRRNSEGQGEGRAQQGISSEKVTVTGNLTLANGMVAIKSGETTYLIPGLMWYVGFIAEIKEGAQVTVEGTANARQADAKTKMLMPLKLKIGSKEYEMGMAFDNNPMQQNRQQPVQPRMGHNKNFRQQAPGCNCQQNHRGPQIQNHGRRK